MKKIILSIFIFIVSCSTDKVSKNHGFRSLDAKYQKITVNVTNKNDLINIIGPPSSKSEFNENQWIYIERKKTNQALLKLGIKKIDTNNVLVVEFNNMGILKNKKLLDLNDMRDVEFIQSFTEKEYEQDNLLYNVLSSLRDKLNSPAGKSKK
tara:strand:+ start:4753 stop:5208 length:456 start_codon:yes stop_codon:yes gene_type:complete